MRRAKIVLAAGLGLAVLASVGASAAALRTRRITFENYQRITHGMSREEVEAILGPHRDFTTVPGSDVAGWRQIVRYHDEFRDGPGQKQLTWMADDATIAVTFDSTGHTYRKEYREAAPEQLTPLQNFCWFARRQWRRWFPEEVHQTGYIRPQPPEF
jgi:hypothetical protein